MLPDGLLTFVNHNLSEIILSNVDVNNVLVKLDKSKAVGGDGLPTIVLKIVVLYVIL